MHELYAAWQDPEKGSCVNKKPQDPAAANPTPKTPTSGRQLIERSDSQRAQELLHAAAHAKSAAPTLFSSGTDSSSPSTSVPGYSGNHRKRRIGADLLRLLRNATLVVFAPELTSSVLPIAPRIAFTQHNGNTAESISRFLDEQFYAPFGAPLLNKDGGPDSNDGKLWWEIVGLSGKQYTLPGGRTCR